MKTKDLIISVGGVGSGKTTSLVLWLIDRMQTDTGQVHALFALTTSGLRGVCRVIDKILDTVPLVRNRERTVSTRPPRAWVADWEKRCVPYPPRQDRYENMRIWPCGLHLQLGTVHNKAYEQYRSSEWGSLAIEEFTLQGFSREAFDFLDERVRCGESENGVECSESLGHRHTKILHGNPPESPDHWCWEMFDTLEKEASALPNAWTSDDTKEGYPNLISGLGPAIMIPSRTVDNTRVGKSYVARKLARLDHETAARRLGGALTRTKIGRVYGAYSHLNDTDQFDYDPNRTLYLSLDFNKDPAVATFHHPLKPGEHPSEHERPGIQQVGTFGTFFHVGGINTEQLCTMLLTNDPKGNHSNMPETFAGLLNHRTKIIFFGDATSSYEKMSGNDWEIVDKVMREALKGRYSKDVPDKRNPLVALTVFAVSAKCLSALGVRSWWLHPRNEELRLDLLTNVWDKTGKDIQKYGRRPGDTSKRWQRGHAGDTLRYFLSRMFPLGREFSPKPTDGVPSIGGEPIRVPKMTV